MLKVLRARYLLVGMLIVFAGYSIFFHHFSNGGHMDVPSPQFAELFVKTRTLCIGRFLIDVPLAADVVYGPADVALKTERYPDKGVDMDLIVTRRLAEIVDEQSHSPKAFQVTVPLVGTVREGVVPGQKIIFGASKSSESFYLIESYLKVGKDLFVQEGIAYGENGEYEDVVRTMNFIAPMLRTRQDGVPPVGPGICIDGGFIQGPSRLNYENLKLGVRLSGFPDVHFSLATSMKPFLIESDELEPRLKQAEQMAQRSGQGAWYSRIKTLRRGQRQIGNWSGFEVLARKPSQASEGESHEFAFVSQGEPNNPLLPVLDLSMHTGVKGNTIGGRRPSITDDEAIFLWDKLTQSIRPRPVE